MIPSLHEVAAQMSLKQFLWNMVRRHCLLITLAGEHLENESPKSLLKLAVLYSIREKVKSQEFFWLIGTFTCSISVYTVHELVCWNAVSGVRNLCTLAVLLVL
jgi:hypothetical protein